MTPRTNRDAGVRWCVAASMVLVSIAGWTPSVAAQSPAMVPNYSGGLHPTVHVDDGKSAWMILGASFASAHKGGTIKVSYKLEPGFRVEVHEDCAPQVTRVPPGGDPTMAPGTYHAPPGCCPGRRRRPPRRRMPGRTLACPRRRLVTRCTRGP